jgi:hypothetical protein
MPGALSTFCIYTIARPDKLAAARKEAASYFEEHHCWTTGCRLWHEADADDLDMAIVFGDATNCSRLIYWGILTNVIPGEGEAHYRVKSMRKFRGMHSPQELVLRSTGETIAPGFIRPYAICRKPSYLR